MINTLTLNPAIDKIIFLQELKKDCTNRIQRVAHQIGGKGTHVSINLSLLGIRNRALGISFGPTGRKIIDELNKYNIEVEFLHYDIHDSRTNYALIEQSKESTILAEKGVILTSDVVDNFLRIYCKTIQEGDFIVLSGDASNVENGEVILKFIEIAKQKNIRVFLDTSGKSIELGITSSPFLIKPNIHELSQICGRQLKTDEDVYKALSEIDKYNIEVIAVSLGANGSIVKYKNEIYRVYPLQINEVNTIGCGDAFLSGMVYGFYNNQDIISTLKCAAAISAATAEYELTVGFNIDRAKELQTQVIIKRI